jgi:hypothetical protein
MGSFCVLPEKKAASAGAGGPESMSCKDGAMLGALPSQYHHGAYRRFELSAPTVLEH